MSCRPRLTPGLLKEAVYCPRLAWIKFHTGVREELTPSMEMGGRLDLKATARKLNLPEPIFYEKSLCNNEHGICGSPDIIAGEKRRVVVEVKAYERRPEMSKHFVEQARIYAWLVQSVLGRVWRYVLVMGERVYTYDYTQHDSQEVLRLVRRVKRMLCSPVPPPGRRDGRCKYCWYRGLCGERLPGEKRILIQV